VRGPRGAGGARAAMMMMSDDDDDDGHEPMWTTRCLHQQPPPRPLTLEDLVGGLDQLVLEGVHEGRAPRRVGGIGARTRRDDVPHRRHVITQYGNVERVLWGEGGG
jgi:hypothetical protein